jgi:Uma2 family endonuclease
MLESKSLRRRAVMSAAMSLAPTAVPSSLPPPFADDALYEVVDGQFVELMKMSALSAMVATDLAGEMRNFAKTHVLGRVVTEALFPIPNRRHQRRPDVAFISYARWAVDRPVPPSDPWPVVPDLAVEVVSPTDILDKLLKKVEAYLRAGVREVWVISPVARRVLVFPAAGNARILSVGDHLDGGEILPGFRLPLEQLLPPVPETEDSDEEAPANDVANP